MEQDGRYIGPQGASFQQINVLWMNGNRQAVFPEKGVRVSLLVCNEDDAGNVDFDGGFALTHTPLSTMGKMIHRLYRMYPGLKDAVMEAEKESTRIVAPGSVANNRGEAN